MTKPLGKAWRIARILLGSLLVVSESATTVLADQPKETGSQPPVPELAWPSIGRQQRPWAYHWWLGSAVDRENLGRELQRYREGGLGGVHIVPIYGAKGAEARYLPYLSPAWMDMLRFAVAQADRLDLGVDMTTGTGWCFGGPNVPQEHGCARVRVDTIPLRPGDRLQRTFDRNGVEAVMAFSADGAARDLLAGAGASRTVDWGADGQPYTIYVLTREPTQVRVKRAAPGGEGLMLNPFSSEAMRHYLERFTKAFAGSVGPVPRAMYHDSFEYRTSWSPDLLAEFEKRRGYRLQDHLPSLLAKEPTGQAARLRNDYRETLSDLMIEKVFPQWVRWCRERGIRTRNQAHGSPGNILDLYTLADIPDTEMFGRGSRDPLVSRLDARFGEGDRSPLVSKFASSAAHVAGRTLVAAETGTWMAEHFCETLEELKCLVDLLFVTGVNHVTYHGCCYSPDDAAWPGWLFYASTQMNPRSAIWHDAPALNAYIARCQAVLQSGQPDNDLLVYWPIHDLWHRLPTRPGNPPEPISCSVHDRSWLEGQPLGATARQLWDRGYGFDYASDRQLSGARVSSKGIAVPGSVYRAVVVPPTMRMPPATFRQLLALAEQGGCVVFQTRLPQDVPGLGKLSEQQKALRELLGRVRLEPTGKAGVQRAALGRGTVWVGDFEAALTAAGIARESLADLTGLRFIRRKHPQGRHYFLANQGTSPVDGKVRLVTVARSVVVMDPMSGRTGVEPMTRGRGGQSELRLRLEPGQSLILRTFEEREVQGPAWHWLAPGGSVAEVRGPWKVEFLQGGPVLPKAYETPAPASWTSRGDPEAERFAGSAVYRTTFDAPAGPGPWLLDLGRVCHSARVRWNGKEMGVLLMNPYRVLLDAPKPTGNLLEVEVTNLSANRIRDLDRRKVPWRVFHDINLVSIRYRPFDASTWPVFDSGLLGPVTLRAVER